MWFYIVGALLAACAFIAYILYRGYNKVRPKPLDGKLHISYPQP